MKKIKYIAKRLLETFIMTIVMMFLLTKCENLREIIIPTQVMIVNGLYL